MKGKRRPFWLPASNYYVMAAAVSAAFFFIVWGLLHDIGDEAPWVTAGISASMLLCGAVILREMILRRAHKRLIQEQNRLERFSLLEADIRDKRGSSKLTLERNAAILHKIKKKSDAAKTLGQVSAGHREVFELCAGYLGQNENALKDVSAGSPRLAALLKGRTAAAEMHRFHLLRWAEIEVREHVHDARNRRGLDDKINAAQSALDVVDFSIGSYPEEPSLVQSRELLMDMLVSIKVSDWLEKAERAVFKHEYAVAKSLYRDALFDLGRDNVQSKTREQAAIRINAEIERIRELEKGR
ncbi:MAG: hypothetical protein AB7J13_04355 [Pyrinomonadaceae bacterium]